MTRQVVTYSAVWCHVYVSGPDSEPTVSDRDGSGSWSYDKIDLEATPPTLTNW